MRHLRRLVRRLVVEKTALIGEISRNGGSTYGKLGRTIKAGLLAFFYVRGSAVGGAAEGGLRRLNVGGVILTALWAAGHNARGGVPGAGAFSFPGLNLVMSGGID